MSATFSVFFLIFFFFEIEKLDGKNENEDEREELRNYPFHAALAELDESISMGDTHPPTWQSSSFSFLGLPLNVNCLKCLLILGVQVAHWLLFVIIFTSKYIREPNDQFF